MRSSEYEELGLGGRMLKIWEIVGWHCTDNGCRNGSPEGGILCSFQYSSCIVNER